MVEYFRFVSQELVLQLNQVKTFIKNHNPTIGILTEEILRSFLRTYLPKGVSVEQGFILNTKGNLSKQCDILIYDSQHYAPFYRINDIVVIPADSVIAIVEVKTTVTKQIFHEVINYFKAFSEISEFKIHKHLFIYKSPTVDRLQAYFLNYKHSGDYQHFDHDTFYALPDTITGINSSYHLRRDYVVFEKDKMGYLSYNYENEKNLEISSLELFYSILYEQIEEYQKQILSDKFNPTPRRAYDEYRNIKSISAIELFDM